MRERGMIFSAPMAKALLAGRKTQTRRLAKITAIMGNRVAITSPDERLIELDDGEFRRGIFHYESTGALSGPYRLDCAVGDRIWVREGFLGGSPGVANIVYRANQIHAMRALRWRSPIHMPRWASRITLTVTDVRVHRLQEITSADAIAEGCPSHANSLTIDCDTPDPRDDYRVLWNSIHGAGAWDQNPWVAAYTFTVEKRP